MSTTSMAPLRGQDTVLASWQALAHTSPGARLIRTPSAVAAVFPVWSPLNNAILVDRPSSLSATAAAGELTHVYGAAGIGSWGLWLPASSASLYTPR